MELPFTVLDKDRWSRLNHPAELMCCRVAQGSKKDQLKIRSMPKPQTTTLPRGSISHQRRMHWWRGWFLKKSGSTPCGGDSSPPWTKDRAIAHKLANAQAKTIDEKPSSKQPFKKRRGLLPVAGYY